VAFNCGTGIAGTSGCGHPLQRVANHLPCDRAAIRRSYPVARHRAYYLSERPRPAGDYRVDPDGSDLQFPSLPISQFDFQCEAYSDCRVASLSWSDFGRIAGLRSELAYKTFHQNDLKQWYQVLLRTSGFLGLRERIAIALLELASDFGIKESRGELLRISPSHQDLADLVGASRPRITEHLAQFEREHLIIRQGRQLIVRADAMEDAIKPTGRGFHCLSVGARRNRSSSSLYPEAAPSVESIAAQAGIQPLA
jgi:Crp-like helix-turn-helix protein